MEGLLAQPARVTQVAVPASSPLSSPAFISPSRFFAAAHGRIAARQRKSLAVRNPWEQRVGAGDGQLWRATPSNSEWVLAMANYGEPYVAAVRKGNVQAVQFHPEKSGMVGLDILRRFLGPNRSQQANVRAPFALSPRCPSCTPRPLRPLRSIRPPCPPCPPALSERLGRRKSLAGCLSFGLHLPLLLI
ncbi:unnamed protein product [Closterium sp. Naga37s-1]|nr:unnamed protein product [Closterium sp. Naga37s-1]